MTINEISKIANVSKSTVFRVLSNPSIVKEETRNKVLEVIERMKKIENSRSIVMILANQIESPTTAKLLEHLEIKALEEGYKPIIGVFRDLEDLENYYVHLCKKHSATAIIATSTVTNLSKFEDLNIPIITVNYRNLTKHSSISIDYDEGINYIKNDLEQQQYKRILLLRHKNDYIKKSDLVSKTNDKINIITIEKIISQDIVFLLENNYYDYIVSTNDLITTHILENFIPLQLHKTKIVSFDNTLFSTTNTFSFTSIEFDLEQISTETFEYIKQMNEKFFIFHKTIQIKTIIHPL